MSIVITISNLKKNYGNHEVLKGVDLSIEKGEIFGILGINGAGKTTLLECIEGFRHYHSGNIKISCALMKQFNYFPNGKTKI